MTGAKRDRDIMMSLARADFIKTNWEQARHRRWRGLLPVLAGAPVERSGAGAHGAPAGVMTNRGVGTPLARLRWPWTS